MLVGLSINGFVILPTLHVEFGPGFCALTGETGVGKSLIVSALEIVLGARADTSLVAAEAERASVTASFEVPPDSQARAMLTEKGLDIDQTEMLILRRDIRRNGGGRAFVNDQAISNATLRETGSFLVELHSQRASLKLLDPHGQMMLLDSYGGIDDARAACASAWRVWQTMQEKCEALDKERDETDAQICYYDAALAEIDALAPEAGEASQLAEERRAGQHADKMHERLDEADAILAGGDDSSGGGHPGVTSSLARLCDILHRLMEAGAGSPDLRRSHEAMERALTELTEATDGLAAARERADGSPQRLDAIEERLFALRAIARKHGGDADALAETHAMLTSKRAALGQLAAESEDAHKHLSEAEDSYRDQARLVSEKRAGAARALADALARELPPLRLEKARFRVRLDAKEHPGPAGAEDVTFDVATNTDTSFGSLAKIASGGEFSRFALALRLCLGKGADTLVFDEADAGIGGATAAAVGERLSRLARDHQILAVTHSPQVAAASDAQWRIVKHEKNGRTEASMTLLSPEDRREEIARMISGARVTSQARAAAGRLLRP